MPFRFGIVSASNITDPNEALDLAFGGETNAGSAGLGSPITFGTNGDVGVQIDEDFLTDDPAASLSQAVTIDGITYPAGARVETDYSFIAGIPGTDIYFRISHISIDNTYVGASISRGFDSGTDALADLYVPGTTLEIVNPDTVSDLPGWEAFVQEPNYNLGPGQAYDNDVDLLDDGSVPICFCAGTFIRMADGQDRRIEELKIGDVVETLDRGARPIRWIGRQIITSDRLAKETKLRPISIAVGALGSGVPDKTLTISPQHRINVSSPIVARMFATDNCLIPAKDLIDLDGVTQTDGAADVVYFHILLDDHCIMLANGTPTESLLLGPQALKGLTAEGRAEIAAIFPDIFAGTVDNLATAASPHLLSRGKRARHLVARHIQNSKPMVSST